MIRFMLAAAVLLFIVPATASAEFYRWVDRDGKEFYSNEKDKIPAEYRSQAKPVEVHEERVSVGSQPAAGNAKPAAGSAKPAVVAEHKDKYGRGEAYWRQRASKLRRELQALQDDHDLLVKQEKDDEGKPTRSTSKKSTKKSHTARDNKKARLEKDIARKQHQIDVELPDEARKADAYPGWLRE